MAQDLTDTQWTCIAPLLPQLPKRAAGRGRQDQAGEGGQGPGDCRPRWSSCRPIPSTGSAACAALRPPFAHGAPHRPPAAQTHWRQRLCQCPAGCAGPAPGRRADCPARSARSRGPRTGARCGGSGTAGRSSGFLPGCTPPADWSCGMNAMQPISWPFSNLPPCSSWPKSLYEMTSRVPLRLYLIRSHFVLLKLVDSVRKMRKFFLEKGEDRPRPVERVSQCGAFSSACGTLVARCRTGACLRGEPVKDPAGPIPTEKLSRWGSWPSTATPQRSPRYCRHRYARSLARTSPMPERSARGRLAHAVHKLTLSVERRVAEFGAMSW